jgi:hypothetical protein
MARRHPRNGVAFPPSVIRSEMREEQARTNVCEYPLTLGMGRYRVA